MKLETYYSVREYKDGEGKPYWNIIKNNRIDRAVRTYDYKQKSSQLLMHDTQMKRLYGVLTFPCVIINPR